MRTKINTFTNAFIYDILKTLKLMSVDGKYNIAAELLSDNNSFPGIDIVKFGETINVFKERITIANCSIIKMLFISNRKKSSSEILIDSPFGKTKTVSILNRLVEKGLVKTIGEGKAKKYFL